MGEQEKRLIEKRMVDLDEAFAYKTFKVVKVLDRRLGFLFYGIQIMIVMYIVLFVLIINKGYLASELALGQVAIKVLGSTYAKVGGSNVPFDSHDLRQPSIENGALFVITNIEGISAQECDEGSCVMKGWCPGLDPNADETMVVRIERPQDLVLWFRSAIAFPGLQPNVTFSSMNHEEPVFTEDNGETDAWTVKELLDIAEAPVNNIIEDGALINVRLEWTCEIDSGKGCNHPQAQVKRLDEGKVRGFAY